jgi:hypothetical protein
MANLKVTGGIEDSRSRTAEDARMINGETICNSRAIRRGAKVAII